MSTVSSARSSVMNSPKTPLSPSEIQEKRKQRSMSRESKRSLMKSQHASDNCFITQEDSGLLSVYLLFVYLF